MNTFLILRSTKDITEVQGHVLEACLMDYNLKVEAHLVSRKSNSQPGGTWAQLVGPIHLNTQINRHGGNLLLVCH